MMLDNCTAVQTFAEARQQAWPRCSYPAVSFRSSRSAEENSVRTSKELSQCSELRNRRPGLLRKEEITGAERCIKGP